MKHFILLLKRSLIMGFLLLFTLPLSAQTVPQGMKYQAVARDKQGDLLSGKNISLKITLQSDTQSPDIYYVEVHKVRTNAFGLFTLVVGEGNVEYGAFDEVPWSSKNIWMELGIHTDGEAEFTSLSNSKLLAVPYAFHAATADELIRGHSENDRSGVPSNVWSLFGNSKTDPMMSNSFPNKDKFGTTDYKDLVFITHDSIRMRITADGEILMGNLIVDSLTVNYTAKLNKKGGQTINYGSFTVDSLSSTHLTGDLTVGKESFLNGQVTIDAAVSGTDSIYGSYPLRIQGSNQGIAIKVSGTRDNSHNYITFWDDDGVQGRIEGETLNELYASGEYAWEHGVMVYNTIIGGVEVIIATAEEIQAIAEVFGAGASSTVCAGAGACVTAPIPSLIVNSTTNLILKTANLLKTIANETVAIGNLNVYNNHKSSSIGVTYSSGAGDYAEWLPKSNLNEKFKAGDIIGVKGGLISHNTAGAEKIMVISLKPIVLGNMPEKEREHEFEKVAFMGQVPVRIWGKAKKGDYILASGNNDGFGKAVHPKNLHPSDFKNIVGISWSDSEHELAGVVTVAVGLNTNELVDHISEQDLKISKQTEEIEALKNRINKIDHILTKLDPTYVSAGSVQPTLNEPSAQNPDMLVVYFKITDQNLEDGISNAEKILTASGEDLNTHPFFMQLNNDPGYKRQYFTRVKSEVNRKIAEQAEFDRKNGATVEIR